MGLFSDFFAHPHPLGRGADIADNGLASVGDVDMLNGHLLPAAASASLERLDLSGERPDTQNEQFERDRSSAT